MRESLPGFGQEKFKWIYRASFLMMNFSFYFLVYFSCIQNQIRAEEETPKENLDSIMADEAAKVWSELSVSGVLKAPKVVYVPDAINKGDPSSQQDGQNILTFGAEKEGSSSLVTRLMGPKADLFLQKVEGLPKVDRRDFIIDLLDGVTKGRYLERKVKNKEGENLRIDMSEFKDISYSELGDEEILDLFKKWLEKTQDRPFSFLNRAARKKIFLGKFPGMPLNKANELKKYEEWVPHFGVAETYIERASRHHGGTNGGWELNFKKQNSYGEFEKMLTWFKSYLGKGEDLFQAPGHMWMVFPYKDLSEDGHNQAKDYMSEIFRNVQAYIALRGVERKTGIEVGHYKNVQRDEELLEMDTTRGILRIESDALGDPARPFHNGTYSYRFGKNTLALELRSGTKDPRVQQFIQKVLAARLSTHDWAPLQKMSDWELVPSEGILSTELPFDQREKILHKFADRYDISLRQLRKFFEQFDEALKKGMHAKEFMQIGYLLPLWNWDDAPYLKNKMGLIRKITKDFISYVAETPNITIKEIREGMRKWVRASNILTDIENYLRPQVKVGENPPPHHFQGKQTDKLDVNKIDMGIEYTGRFPHKFSAEYTEKFDDGKKQWLETLIGYTPEEREETIRNVAKSLSQNLGNPNETPITRVVNENGHGHGLGVTFEFRDPANRKWRVEWDGIGRSYDPDGNVVDGSGRSGHMELVTPKFQPTYEEMKKVFEAFSENNVIPSHKAGGGHINVDLAPFEKNPRAFARFLSLFHQYRGIMAMLFQDMGRLKSAEPAQVSRRLSKKLADFRGSDDELKRLLYEERYFNPRVGRKTRYLQLDVSGHFQDVIPSEFIHDDFDINNPEVLWRPQFRVDPKIRKMEFRMMDAPLNAIESALQIKLVRALLNKAFNEDGPLSGQVQKVDYKRYADKPQLAFDHLREMSNELGLDYEEYKGRLAESIAKTQLDLKSSFYQPLEERLKLHPRLEDVWGKAVKARGIEEGISSSGRSWEREDGSTLTLPHPLAMEIQKIKKEAVKKGVETRKDYEHHRPVQCFRRNLRAIPTLVMLEHLVENFEKNMAESDEMKGFVRQGQVLLATYEKELKELNLKSYMISMLQNIVDPNDMHGLSGIWVQGRKEMKVKEFYEEILGLHKNNGLFSKEEIIKLYEKTHPLIKRVPLAHPFPGLATVPVTGNDPVGISSSIE